MANRKSFTKQELRDLIGVLREARVIIEDKEERYLCVAIELVDEIHGGYSCKAEYLVSWIDSMLEGCSTLGLWLVEHGHVKSRREEYRDLDDGYAMRHLRLRWIDWMIEQLRAEIRGMK